MADNRSQGPVQVMDTSLISINDALRQVQIRLDHLKGLNGRVLTYDRVRVDDPTAAEDAVSLGTGQTTLVTVSSTQTITAVKTFSALLTATAGATITAPVRVLDSSGNLVHAFGTTT